MSSKKIEGIEASFQCRLHTRRPRHSNPVFASSLLRVHVRSALVSPHRYRKRDSQCIFGYTRSCTVTNAVSGTHEITHVETYQVLHLYFILIPIIRPNVIGIMFSSPKLQIYY